MLAGQAIGTGGMDLMATSNIKSTNSTSESGVANQKDSVSFDKLLSQNSMKNYSQKKDFDYGSKQDVSKKMNTRNVKVADSSMKMQNKVKSEQLNNVTTESKVEGNNVAEKVATVVNEVKESLMETLDLSEEELVSMMEMMGVGMIDLLNPDVISQLVMNNSEITDSSMFLTNDDLAQQLNQLLTKLNDCMKDANLTPEEIKTVTSNPVQMEQFTEVLQTLTTTNPQQVVKESVDVNVEHKQESNESKEESKIQFTVVKEDSNSESKVTTTAMTDSKEQGQHSEAKSEATLANQFVDQLVNANVTVNEGTFSENLREIHELREVANQIIDQVKLTIKPEHTSMEFTLTPDSLGKVALNITSKNGLLTASFTTENHIAKEAIESQMQVLKDNLSNQGIKVDAIEVNVSEFGFNQSTEMNQGSNGKQDSSSNQKKAFRMNAGDTAFVEETAEINEQIAIDSGSQIDYSA